MLVKISQLMSISQIFHFVTPTLIIMTICYKNMIPNFTNGKIPWRRRSFYQYLSAIYTETKYSNVYTLSSSVHTLHFTNYIPTLITYRRSGVTECCRVTLKLKNICHTIFTLADVANFLQAHPTRRRWAELKQLQSNALSVGVFYFPCLPVTVRLVLTAGH